MNLGRPSHSTGTRLPSLLSKLTAMNGSPIGPSRERCTSTIAIPKTRHHGKRSPESRNQRARQYSGSVSPSLCTRQPWWSPASMRALEALPLGFSAKPVPSTSSIGTGRTLEPGASLRGSPLEARHLDSGPRSQSTAIYWWWGHRAMEPPSATAGPVGLSCSRGATVARTTGVRLQSCRVRTRRMATALGPQSPSAETKRLLGRRGLTMHAPANLIAGPGRLTSLSVTRADQTTGVRSGSSRPMTSSRMTNSGNRP